MCYYLNVQFQGQRVNNNDGMINNNYGRLEDFNLVKKFLVSTQKDLFENYIQFGQASSKSFVTPVQLNSERLCGTFSVAKFT